MSSKVLEHEDFPVEVGQAYTGKHILGVYSLDNQPRVSKDSKLLNVHREIPLFRYIDRQFVLLVSIIRRLTRKRRGQSLQHLHCPLLNILSFQLLDFIKEIGTIQTLIFNIALSFNLMFTIRGR